MSTNTTESLQKGNRERGKNSPVIPLRSSFEVNPVESEKCLPPKDDQDTRQDTNQDASQDTNQESTQNH